MGSAYIHINKDYFDENKDIANDNAKEDDENSKDYLWSCLNFEVDTLKIENDKVFVGGSTDLGYISLDFKLDMDTAIDVIEFYMKKLGKLKTILEATK